MTRQADFDAITVGLQCLKNGPIREAAFDALERLEAASPLMIPPGWRLVPESITPEMVLAWRNASDFYDGYRKALAASLQAPSVGDDVVERAARAHFETGRGLQISAYAWSQAREFQMKAMKAALAVLTGE